MAKYNLSAMTRDKSPVLSTSSEYVKVQPHAIPLEQAVLGACMLSPTAFTITLRILQSEHFYTDCHQQLFKIFESLYQKNEAIDILTVFERGKQLGFIINETRIKELEVLEAEKNGRLNREERREYLYLKKAAIPGPVYLAELTNRIASAANIEYHARIIYQKFMRRELFKLAVEAMNKAGDDSFDILETYTDFQQQLRFNSPMKMLEIQNMNEAINAGEKEGIAKKLCGSLLTESDVCFWYSEAGIGKTAVVVQIADAISKGKSFLPEPAFVNECDPKGVLLIDFELQNSELFSRYSKRENEVNLKYQFHENFKRASIKADFIDFDEAEKHILLEVETLIMQEQPGLVIIDNITYLTAEASDNKMATKFMKKIIALQRKATNKMSIIVIAHTKKRDKSQPLTKDDMKGASELNAFAKNMISIGYSKLDPKLRYVKQTKVRNAINDLDETNVAVFEIDKPDTCLKYIFRKFTHENVHLISPELDEGVEEDAINDAVKMHNNNKGYGKIQGIINEQYGLSWSRATVRRRILKEKEARAKRRSFKDIPPTHVHDLEELREFEETILKEIKEESENDSTP